MALHTAYLGKVLSTNGKTAKIQPLGKVKAYNEEAKDQKPLSDVPILQSARYKFEKKTLTYVSGISGDFDGISSLVANVDDDGVLYWGESTSVDGESSITSITKSIDVLVPTEIAVGDIVLCVCCERDITEAKKGNNAIPALGHHSQSASVIVGVL